jgi:signal transduction histidine kinase
MRMSLAFKQILAFLIVALTATLLMALFVRRTSDDELSRLIIDNQGAMLRSELVEFYLANRGWEGVNLAVRGGGRPGAILPGRREPRFGLVDLERVVHLPWAQYEAGHRVDADVLNTGMPLVANGATIGYFFVAHDVVISTPETLAFVAHTNQALLQSALGSILLAVALGLLLTRGLLSPIRDLTRATQALMSGQRGAQIQVHSGDELGQLSSTFNKMSSEIARAEDARRQMTADIAHDLRTPLTVLSATIEGLEDGTLDAAPEHYSVMQVEVNHLIHLVEDLMTLSKADANAITLKRQPVALLELFSRIASAYAVQAAQKGITLTQEADKSLILSVDLERMCQVLGNLVSNALRHTPTGGIVRMCALRTGDATLITIEDTGEGIPLHAQTKIFERFYRADSARSGEASGLGLAIARALVEAHGGRIAVASTPGRGTTFTMTFPMRVDFI